MRADFLQEETGPLWIYEQPDPDETYVIGIDCQEGKVRSREAGAISERTGSKDPDFNAMSVIRLSDGLECASYLSNFAPGLVVEDAFLLGHHYGKESGCEENAFLVPEINGPGVAVVEGLRERQYDRMWVSKRWNRLDQCWDKSIGWRTTMESRPIMVKALQDEIREATTGIQCFRTVSHIASMRYNKQGKAEAPYGAHDDLAFAQMLAIQGRRALYHEPREEETPLRRDPDRAYSDWVAKKEKEIEGESGEDIAPWEEMAW